MKKILTMILAALFLLVTIGCQNSQDKLYEEMTRGNSSQNETGSVASASQPDLTLDETEPKVLTIRQESTNESETIYILAQQYMREHENVTIKFQADCTDAEWQAMSAAERIQMRESYEQKVKMEIISGEADYLCYQPSAGIDIYQLTQQGVLRDLKPYFENDSEIRPEDYFVKAFEASSVDGKWPKIPIQFVVYCCYFNRAILDELGVDAQSLSTGNSDEILDWYEQARETHPDLQLGFSAPGKDVLYIPERARYMDLEADTASFDSPECIRFLERTDQVINDEPAWNAETDYNHLTSVQADQLLRYRNTGEEPKVSERRMHLVKGGRESFITVEYISLLHFQDYGDPMEYMAGPVILNSTNGKTVVNSGEDLILPVSMKDPALAWDFIKYCISEMDSVPGFDPSIPVNKNTFLNTMETISYIAANVDGYRDYRVPEEVDGELAVDRLEKALTGTATDIKFYGSADLQPFLDEFYIDGLTTAEQCAKKMQERAEIWLHE